MNRCVISKIGVETGYETELRFGRFDQRGKFIPGVSKSQFELLIENMNRLGVKKIHTVDTVHSRSIDMKTGVRKIVSANGRVLYEKKEKVKTIDVPEYSVRLAKSRETQVPHTMFNRLNSKNEYVQKRDRHSYFIPGVRVDLTFLPRNNTYQVELEFTNVDAVCNLFPNIQEILNRWMVMKEYKKLVGNKFIGPLPQTLTLQAFNKKVLAKTRYSVTDKADGERFLLYVAPNGFFYFISRKMNLELAPYQPRPDMANSIIDGEFSKTAFFAFDAAYIRGTNVMKKSLPQRLQSVFDFVMAIRTSNLKMKTFYIDSPSGVRSYPGNTPTKFRNIYEAAGAVWSKRTKFPYELDGLIFTPVDDTYTSRNIYKWKDENTIDFYYKTTNSKTQLFLAGLDSKNAYSMIPFSGNDGKGTFKTARGTVKNAIFTDETAPENIRKGILNYRISGPPQVGEFKFENNTFLLIRRRPDKEFPNSIQASNQSWEAISKPVLPEMIAKGPSTMRDFHSEIKSKLIMTYAKNRSVLDIGSGKGEDIGKYVKAGSKPVVGFDLVGVEYPHPNYMNFYKMNNSIYNVKNTLKNKYGKFDVVNINFAIHYFFKNKKSFESLILNISNNLKKGGYLMATVLDGSLVYKALKNKNTYSTNRVNFTKKYNNSLNFENKKFKMLGQAVNVLVKGTKYFNKPIEEYLFNFQKFMMIMEKMGFEVVETKNFSELCSESEWCRKYMSSNEKDYSFKNMYFVLQKK